MRNKGTICIVLRISRLWKLLGRVIGRHILGVSGPRCEFNARVGVLLSADPSLCIMKSLLFVKTITDSGASGWGSGLLWYQAHHPCDSCIRSDNVFPLQLSQSRLSRDAHITWYRVAHVAQRCSISYYSLLCFKMRWLQGSALELTVGDYTAPQASIL